MSKEKEKTETAKPASGEKEPGEKTETAEPASGEKKPGASTGKKPKEVTVKVGKVEFTGLCTAERKLPGGGSQVFLKLKGDISRWFNSEDVVK